MDYDEKDNMENIIKKNNSQVWNITEDVHAKLFQFYSEIALIELNLACK